MNDLSPIFEPLRAPDAEHYDAETAGRWLWGMACWIGGRYCAGNGPWTYKTLKAAEELGTYDIRAIKQAKCEIVTEGQGINRKRPHLSCTGQGIRGHGGSLKNYLRQLSERLRSVNVCCGGWDRIMGPCVTGVGNGSSKTCAVLLDPPYAVEDRAAVYTTESFSVAREVREWCKANGDIPGYRIALCGYDTEHSELEALGWSVVEWKAPGGYAHQSSRDDAQGKANRKRERVWFSPHCISPAAPAGENDELLLFTEEKGGN